MQREDPEGIVILCDFCRREWDGQEAMIEGHHGSIICLQCLQKALNEQAPREGKYKCTLCLRFNISPELPRWHGIATQTDKGETEQAIICQECLYQSARTFSRNPDIDFKFEPAKYPPLVKPPRQPETPE